jgi:hypothetical protein
MGIWFGEAADSHGDGSERDNDGSRTDDDKIVVVVVVVDAVVAGGDGAR